MPMHCNTGPTSMANCPKSRKPIQRRTELHAAVHHVAPAPEGRLKTCQFQKEVRRLDSIELPGLGENVVIVGGHQHAILDRDFELGPQLLALQVRRYSLG